MARPLECTTLVARWTASHPDSPKLAGALRELRSADYFGADESGLSASIIASLVELYRGHPLTDPRSPGPVNNAIHTSNFYASFYQHVFPFDRNALRQAWSACVANPRTVMACTRARRQLEREIGSIYPKNAPN
jgi:hypothetical protein